MPLLLFLCLLPALAHASTGAEAPPAIAPEIAADTTAGADAEGGGASGIGPVRVGGRVQARYELRRPEVGEPLSSFYLRRVRIDLRGELLDGRLSFRVMPELAGTPSLRDGWIEYAAAPMLRVRMGQFAAPFQWLRFVSGNRQHFAERGNASEAFFGFPGGYDIGVGANGRNPGNTFAYSAALFDGAGRNVRLSNSAGHMASGRMMWAPAGTVPEEEPDLAHSTRVQLAVGAGLQGATMNEVRAWDLGRSPAENHRADWLSATADLVLRWRGLSLVPAGYLRRVWPDDPAVEAYDGFAHVVSLGFFAVPERLELVARHTGLRVDAEDPATAATEWSVGTNLYHLGHGWKTQIDYTRHAGTLVAPAHVFLVQMHLQF